MRATTIEKGQTRPDKMRRGVMGDAKATVVNVRVDCARDEQGTKGDETR